MSVDGARLSRRNAPSGHVMVRLLGTTWGRPAGIEVGQDHHPLSEAAGLKAQPGIEIEYSTEIEFGVSPRDSTIFFPPKGTEHIETLRIVRCNICNAYSGQYLLNLAISVFRLATFFNLLSGCIA